MLLLLFAGADEAPPPEEEFHAVGGKGVRAPARHIRTGRSATSQAEGAAFALEMQAQQAAERDARDLRDVQELIAALFAFKGIF